MSATDFFLSAGASALTIPLAIALSGGVSYVRNWWLERSLRKELAPSNIEWVRVRQDGANPAPSDERVGLGIENKTGQPVTIRRVIAWSGRTGADLELYDRAAMSLLRSFRTGAVKDHWGWVELPPFSRAIWFLEGGQERLGKLDRVDVELTYPTLFGSAKKIVIHPDKKVLPELLAHLQQGLPGNDEGQSAA